MPPGRVTCIRKNITLNAREVQEVAFQVHGRSISPCGDMQCNPHVGTSSFGVNWRELDAMDLSDIRRRNLGSCLDKLFEKNQSAMGRELHMRPNQINDMIHGRKSFGERVARRIEERLKLPRYALDEDLRVDVLERAKAALNHQDLAWPFSISRERFTRLPNAVKLRVEGAMLGVIQEYEKCAPPRGNRIKKHVAS